MTSEFSGSAWFRNDCLQLWAALERRQTCPSSRARCRQLHQCQRGGHGRRTSRPRSTMATALPAQRAQSWRLLAVSSSSAHTAPATANPFEPVTVTIADTSGVSLATANSLADVTNPGGLLTPIGALCRVRRGSTLLSAGWSPGSPTPTRSLPGPIHRDDDCLGRWDLPAGHWRLSRPTWRAST